MRVYLLLLSIFLCSISFAQKHGKYNAKDQLIADTSHLSKRQIKRLSSVQDTLIKQILTNISYPEVEMEAQIQGTAFVSFTVNESDSLRDFKMLRAVPGGPGLGKEAFRVLKKVRLPIEKQAKTRKKDSIYCRLAFRFTLTGGGVSKGNFSNGTIIITESGTIDSTPKDLDPKIKKWIDSVSLIIPKWYTMSLMKQDAGDWNWYYVHGKRVSDTGNPYKDTFYVMHYQYPRGYEGSCSDCGSQPRYWGHSFIYYPGSKKLDCSDNEIVYLLDKIVVFNKQVWGCITENNDTLYKGPKDAYVQFPGNPSRYFVFINNLYSNGYRTKILNRVIIGPTKQSFKKEDNYPGGTLISCQFLTYYYDLKNNTSATKDSTIYLFFDKDSAMPFHQGDTVLLNVESPQKWYNEKKHTYLAYSKVIQYYPFKISQVENLLDYRSYGDFMQMAMWSRCSIFYRLFHGGNCPSAEESDPVFRYLRKNKLYYKY